MPTLAEHLLNGTLNTPTEFYDYTNQAWVVNGRYVRCGHKDSKKCNCFGRVHAGEVVRADAELY